jgi:excisionase family DNA binding protein
MRQYWRVDEVAKLLGVSSGRIYAMTRRGEIPPSIVVRLGKRELRFHMVGFAAWLRTRTLKREAKHES